MLQTAIVEHLQLVRNDERHNTIRQAFLKHNKPADTAVAVLERVYCLETLVQVQNIIKRFFLLDIIFLQESFDLAFDIFRSRCFVAADTVPKSVSEIE